MTLFVLGCLLDTDCDTETLNRLSVINPQNATYVIIFMDCHSHGLS